MKTRFEPRLPRMSSWKKLHTLDLNSGPLHVWQVLCHWTIKADTKGSHISILVPVRTNKDSFLPVTFTGLADLFPQLGSCYQQLCGNSMYLALVVKCQITYNCFRGPGFKAWVRLLIFFHADILGRLGSNLVFIVPFGTSCGDLELRYG
jgi:hypothetical protein